MYKKLLCVVGILMLSVNTSAKMTVKVFDRDNKPLSNITVELFGNQTNMPIETVATNAVMNQVNQQFDPHILVVQKGTQVSFPDTDTVRHHVYSFSDAKTFEMRINKEAIQRQILFDNAGVVELGCNIHDWMLGYLYVAESALFTQTDKSGDAEFIDVPLGEYQIKVWHPRFNQKDVQIKHNATYSQGEQIIEIRLAEKLKPSFTDFDDVHALDSY